MDVFEKRKNLATALFQHQTVQSSPVQSSPVANPSQPPQAHAPAMNQNVSPRKFCT